MNWHRSDPFELQERYPKKLDQFEERLKQDGYIVINDVIQVDIYSLSDDYVVVPAGTDFNRTVLPKLPRDLERKGWQKTPETIELDDSSRIGMFVDDSAIRAELQARGFFVGDHSRGITTSLT